MLGLEVAALGECELARLLQDKLRYEMRLQYMVRPCPLPCHPATCPRAPRAQSWACSWGKSLVALCGSPQSRVPAVGTVGTAVGTLVARLVDHWCHRYDSIDEGTLVAQLVGVWWQLVGRWWHRYGDSIGTDMGTLVAQVWGPWWGRYGDCIGTDMGTLVAQL